MEKYEVGYLVEEVEAWELGLGKIGYLTEKVKVWEFGLGKVHIRQFRFSISKYLSC